MRRRSRIPALARTLTLLAGVGVPCLAQAADLPPPMPAPLPEPEVFAGGWYLRVDGGYGSLDLRKSLAEDVSHPPKPYDYAVIQDKVSNQYFVGAGVGYQINSYLRTDVTFDYLTSADFRGSTSGVCGDGVGNPFVACSSTDRSYMHAYSLMANAYVDLGTYGYVTPYVGAGIGGTYVKWGKLKNRICDDPYQPGCYGGDHDGEKSWRFTYALMAGATVDITCALKADVGYRFRHIAGGDMFGYLDRGGPGYDKGFYSHEARVGARYVFGGCDTPVAYEPAPEPIVYK